MTFLSSITRSAERSVISRCMLGQLLEGAGGAHRSEELR